MTETQTRRQLISRFSGRQPKPVETDEIDWNDLCERIKDQQVIPFISGSLSYDAIFAERLKELHAMPGAVVGPGLHVRAAELIAENWSAEIAYPLPDSYDLSRVAQYYCSTARDERIAKTNYLRYLKDLLLNYAEEQGADPNRVQELRERAQELSFAELAALELGYPKYSEGAPGEETDPLKILAGLPLPIYVTTGCHDFLELALREKGKEPVSQTCFWDRVLVSEAPDVPFVPTVARPLVFHLFGHEPHPTSLVLSEDDYLNFLVEVTQSVDTRHPLIPSLLVGALSVTSVMLVGYRLMDWDFRVLSRGVLQSKTRSRLYNWIVQLQPDQQFQVQNAEDARRCLEKYLEPKQLYISWGEPDSFLRKLEQKRSALRR